MAGQPLRGLAAFTAVGRVALADWRSVRGRFVHLRCLAVASVNRNDGARISNMIGRSFVVVAVSLLLSSCVTAGSTATGQRFGVQVGMPFEEASAVLQRRGFQQEPSTFNERFSTCGLRNREAGETLEAFSSQDRQTTVCLFVASERVVAVAWEGTWL